MEFQSKTDDLLARLASFGWETGLTRESYERIAGVGLRGDSPVLAAILAELAVDCQPITVRGLFYRAVSAGYFPSTDKKYYDKTQRLLCRLRAEGIIPYEWVVDNLRATIKPSSWSGLESFADTVRDAYRKDFWSHLPAYVHVFCEKDAMTGVIEPVTREYDVALSPVRGYISDSYVHSIGKRWGRIRKPIMALYLGDFDPSGFDLERSLREKLRHHAGRDFDWVRLGLNARDFQEHALIPLGLKKKKDGSYADSRAAKFIQQHGYECAEIDALDPNVIRQRVRVAVTEHIPEGEWERLQEVERLERESWEQTLGTFGNLDFDL